MVIVSQLKLQGVILNLSMKTLIFEGIVTSGKSTISKSLVESLSSDIKIDLATEERTHEPIMSQRDDLHIDFFKNLINQIISKRPDLLIFDRLYITQAYRANSGLTAYSEVEKMLLPYTPSTIILKVDESKIADRIQATALQRGKEWQDFWKTKGKNFEEIAQGYIKQQRGLLALVKQSKIPHLIFDTTDNNFQEVAEKIKEIIKD